MKSPRNVGILGTIWWGIHCARGSFCSKICFCLPNLLPGPSLTWKVDLCKLFREAQNNHTSSGTDNDHMKTKASLLHLQQKILSPGTYITLGLFISAEQAQEKWPFPTSSCKRGKAPCRLRAISVLKREGSCPPEAYGQLREKSSILSTPSRLHIHCPSAWKASPTPLPN